jgi:hypothetical protein
LAETPVERGAYLVTSIGACGNCHTPREAGLKPIPGMDALAAIPDNCRANASDSRQLARDLRRVFSPHHPAQAVGRGETVDLRPTSDRLRHRPNQVGYIQECPPALPSGIHLTSGLAKLPRRRNFLRLQSA